VETFMSLEALYNDADPKTYVGQVRTKQSNDVGAGASNSFLDGTRKTTRTLASADLFQKEFTRNAGNSYVAGGAQGTVPTTSDKSYPLSRWTPKALKLAFEQDGPASLSRGYYNDRFRTAVSNTGNVLVHNYTPLAQKGFKDLNVSAKNRIQSSPTSYL